MADQSPTESDSSTTPEFPDKMRVHALAKLLGVTSKQVLAEAAALGTELRSAQSSLHRDVAQRIHASLASAAEAIEPVGAVDQRSQVRPPTADVLPEQHGDPLAVPHLEVERLHQPGQL